MLAAFFAVAGCVLAGYGLAEADPVNFCIGAVLIAGVVGALTQDALKTDK